MSEENETFPGEPKGDPVEVVPYDSLWPQRFEQEKTRLSRALGENALRIDHVGSTAVPGLAAKPVIDAQISVASLDDESSYLPQLHSLGLSLRYRGEERRFFRPPEYEPRTLHVHVCESGSRSERGHLLFAAYLRAHPARRDAYAMLKRDLARRFRDRREDYLASKAPFIQQTLILAEKWITRTKTSL